MHRFAWLLFAVGLLGGCSDTSGSAGVTTTTAPPESPIAVCREAASTFAALPPPGTFEEAKTHAATAAVDIAIAADTVEDPNLRAALKQVADGLAALSRAEVGPAAADAVATLTATYDTLDDLASGMETAECGSESWGRQIVAAAADFTGAGG